MTFPKGDEPRVGDKVQVSFETTVASGAPNPYVVWVNVEDGREGPGRIVCVPTYAVEVLERADDPSRNEVGTIRRLPAQQQAGADSAPLGPIAVKWDANDQHPWVWMRWDGAQLLSDETVTGWPVIGAVPGTPAAEAAQREQVYPDVSGGGAPYPPVHVDNAAIVAGQYYGKQDREPGRVHIPTEVSHEGVDACGRPVVHTGPRERCAAAGCRADVAEARGVDVQTLHDDGSDEYARAIAERGGSS